MHGLFRGKIIQQVGLGQTGRFGDLTGDRHRRGGEVQPGHPRPEPGQREGVGPDVALQVDAAQTADVTQARHVEPDDVGQPVRVGDQVLHRISRRGAVGGCPGVPPRPVDLAVLVVHINHCGSCSPTRQRFTGEKPTPTLDT